MFPLKFHPAPADALGTGTETLPPEPPAQEQDIERYIREQSIRDANAKAKAKR